MLQTLRRAGLGLLMVASAMRAQVGPPQAKPPARSAQRAAQAHVAPIVTPWDVLHQAGKDVTVYLLTMGDGDQVWEMFGHTAIQIHVNAPGGADSIYNWGEFDMSKPHFILHFMKGLNEYQMGSQSLDQLMRFYRHYDRSITSQELDLTATQKDSLLRAIQRNEMPDSLTYRYDYFVDNCATRPRDLLDHALGGQLRTNARALAASGTSYRWQTMLHMNPSKPLVLGVDIGLGEPADRDITTWETMFLPVKLHDFLQGVSVHDSTGDHPLVANNRVLYQSKRPAEPTAPVELGAWLLGGGILIAGLIAWAGAAVTSGGTRTRAGTTAAAVAIGLWSFIAGLLGVVLTGLWTATDHKFAYFNENLLLFNPLWLVAGVMLMVSVIRGRGWRWTRQLALFLASLTVVALVAHVVPLSTQVNLPIIGLALPPALAILWVASRGLAHEPAASLSRARAAELDAGYAG